MPKFRYKVTPIFDGYARETEYTTVDSREAADLALSHFDNGAEFVNITIQKED